MSRGNINGMYADPSGGTVVFNCRRGEVRSYHYGMADFLEILGGSDPKDFLPDGEGGGSGEIGDIGTGDAAEAGSIADVGDAIIDIGLITGF